MKNSFSVQLKNFFSSFGKIILLVLICIASAFIIVFPFWYFADRAPDVYTVVFSVLFICALVALIVLSIVKKYRGKSPEEKKIVTHNILRVVLIVFLCLFTVNATIALVLSYQRIAALILFVLGFASVGVTAFCVKKK